MTISKKALVFVLTVAVTTAFSPSGRTDVTKTASCLKRSPIPVATLLPAPVGLRSDSFVPLNLFGNDEDASESNKDSDTTSKAAEEKTGLEKIPFFGRFARSNLGQEVADAATETSISSSNTATATTPPAEEANDPETLAKTLRAQAERARLEAERMDAELTLEKIDRLERQLAQARTKGDAIDDLQRQMDNLQAKLRGEAPKPVIVEKPKKETKSDEEGKPEAPTASVSLSKSFTTDLFGTGLSIESESDFKKAVDIIESLPGFLKIPLAQILEVETHNDAGEKIDVNATKVVERFIMSQSGDYSYSSLPEPSFSDSEIEERKKLIAEGSNQVTATIEMVKAAEGNETKLALYSLEYDYYVDDVDDVEIDDYMESLVAIFNKTAVDQVIELQYPKCIDKENAPTLSQVELLMSSVLPKAKFSTTAKPEEVFGGYIIRGNHRYETGDELIDRIDREIARTSLGDKMTILYTPDLTKTAKVMEAMEDGEDFVNFDLEPTENILYVVGPDVAPEPKRVLLAITSGLGLATSWYLALYPFLLNPTLGKRIEEQLALADASMAYDLDWLTELSLPLFFTFVGLQLSHELAHSAVAGLYNMTTTAPTFVPSLVTGITSAVTSFKKPPKNRKEIFDFSLAGPLTGILASLVAVVIGSSLTLSSDPATLPGLPLEILRQSTLGGTIINSILGNGALNLPDGAVGTQAVASMIIPLHPVAIAGYISLFINALNLLPIGTSDGGRIALALFGRDKKAPGFIALMVLLISGLLGSDLFLFYFAFAIAFQAGNEMPARNEVDEVDFPRVLVATASIVLSLLVLVPFQ